MRRQRGLRGRGLRWVAHAHVGVKLTRLMTVAERERETVSQKR